MKKILIVEDDRFLASAYRIKLTKSNFEIKIAANGEEAIQFLKDFVPDLILLDLVMPVKDGFTTLKEIKENPTWQKIPIIIASNLGQKEDFEKGLKMGAVDYIVKSDLSLDALVEKINKTIK
jgi:two-component system, OmpR family, alkaline phosphatase synthesis response regulator PhoP